MELIDYLQLIELKLGAPITTLSPLKIKAILFFSHVEYFSTEGESLIDAPIRCYYNTIEIDGLSISDQQMEEAGSFEVDALIDDLITEHIEIFEAMSDEDVLAQLYQSKAFLKANLARGHRLTKKVLQEYHEFFTQISRFHTIASHFNIDEAIPQYELIDDLSEDRSIQN